MSLDLVVRNARIVLPDRVESGWVGIQGGRIAAISTDQPPQDLPGIDAAGGTLLAGRIEPHCHVRGGLLGDDLESTSKQAVAGGVTTLMPYMRAKESYLDLLPAWERLVAERSRCDVSFHLQIQIRDHLREIGRYHEEFGVQSIKVHIDYRRPSGPLDILPVDDGDVFLAMQAVREFDGVVAVHCEDSEITRYLIDDVRSAGRADLSAWADARPPIAEAADVNTVVYLAKALGARVLIVHVSSPDSLTAAETHGYRRTHTEVLVHQLIVPREDAEVRFGAYAKFNPPLRDRVTAEALWDAVKEGRIDFVGTDHSAFSSLSDEALQEPAEFWEEHRHVSAGIGVALPMFLTEGLAHGIDLPRLSHLMSARSAEVFGMADRKGRIEVGKDADLVLVDLDAERTVTSGTPQSPGVTIADGMVLRGWPILTLLRGATVFSDDHLASDPVVAEVIRRR